MIFYINNNFVDFFVKHSKYDYINSLSFHLLGMTQQIYIPSPQQFTPEQIEALKPRFAEIDLDKNGTIDINETKKFMEDINLNPVFAPLVFEICDTNKDGQISFDEFGPYLAFLDKLDQDPKCIYKYIFDKYDTDKNGLLDKNELRELFKLFSSADWTDEDVEAMIDKKDKNSDGYLDFSEVCKLLSDE